MVSQFPLIFWETTEDFKKEALEGLQKFDRIQSLLKEKGFRAATDFRVDPDGDFELHHGVESRVHFGNRYNNLTAEEALAHVMANGERGRFTLDELEKFSLGRGPIVERAMWTIGFRHSKQHLGRWSKRKHGEPNESERLHHQIRNRRIKEYEIIDPKKAEELLVLPLRTEDDAYRNNSAYRMHVGSRDMIHIYFGDLIVPKMRSILPHAKYSLDPALENIVTGAHIATQQKGFGITAKNVTWGKNLEGIFVHAYNNYVRDEPHISYQCIWPAVASAQPHDTLQFLAEDLVEKMKRKLT